MDDRCALCNENYAEGKGLEIGLVNVYAYHCNRCNYTWLPKDFDMLSLAGVMYNKSGKSDGFSGHDLLYRELPKSCARCKSKSWNVLYPRRKKPNSDVKTWLQN
jgi:hypothetical protein